MLVVLKEDDWVEVLVEYREVELLLLDVVEIPVELVEVRGVDLGISEVCEFEMLCSFDLWEVLSEVEVLCETCCPELELVEASCALEV